MLILYLRLHVTNAMYLTRQLQLQRQHQVKIYYDPHKKTIFILNFSYRIL